MAKHTYANGTAVPGGTNLTSYFLEDYAMQVGVTTKLGYDIDRHNHAYIGYWYQNEDYLTHFPVSAQMANGFNPSPNNAAYQRTPMVHAHSPVMTPGLKCIPSLSAIVRSTCMTS